MSTPQADARLRLRRGLNLNRPLSGLVFATIAVGLGHGAAVAKMRVFQDSEEGLGNLCKETQKNKPARDESRKDP